jgi:serine/threonine-protein kinase
MLTGERPPKLAANPARPPSAIVGELSGDLAARVDRLTLGLLEADPNLRRPQRAAEVVEALRGMLEGPSARGPSASLSGASPYEPTQRASRPPSAANIPAPRQQPIPSAPPVPSYGAYLPPPSMPLPPRPAPPIIVQQPVAQVVPLVRVVPVVPVIVKPPSSGKATASLVLGIAALLLACIVVGGLPGVLAAIFGHLALRDIRRSEGRLRGQGAAIAGLLLGYFSIGLALLIFFSLHAQHAAVVVNMAG